MPDQTRTLSESISQPAAVEQSTISAASAGEPLQAALLDAESRFYRDYSWCVNAYPTLHEVVPLLRQHLDRLDDFAAGWQRAEVMTNVFLLSCAIADAVDDYLLGERLDFSQVAAVVPGTGLLLRAAAVPLGAVRGAREWRFRRLHTWRRAWGEGVQDFLKIFVTPGEPDTHALLLARTRLASLLSVGFPGPLGGVAPGSLPLSGTKISRISTSWPWDANLPRRSQTERNRCSRLGSAPPVRTLRRCCAPGWRSKDTAIRSL